MESVLRGVAVYVILLMLIRVSGRRTMAEMTAFDFVLILIIAETTQQALLGNDFSITNAALLIITLFTLDIGLSYLKRWSKMAAKLIDGHPTVLIRDGEIDRRALRRARIDTADILAAARVQHGLERLEQVKHAVLENDSGVSITPRKA